MTHQPSSRRRVVSSDVERTLRARRFQWLILGALGVAPYGCGGRTTVEDADIPGGDPPAQGGSAAGASPGASGAAGAVGFAGDSGAGGRAGDGYGTGGADTGYGPVPTTVCQNDTTLDGGWLRCDSGMLHRASAGQCDSILPRPEPTVIPPYAQVGEGTSLVCHADADCTEAPYGHCEAGLYVPGTYCAYGCVQDSDCADGQVCLCGNGPVGACHAASCRVDSDCPGQSLCASYIGDNGCGWDQFACQSVQDECAVAADCPVTQGCVLDTSLSVQRRVCIDVACPVPGRPFLIEGRQRLASTCDRGDWCAQLEELSASLADAELSAAVGHGWIEQGLMEHASVAAFARFSLQLLSLGAPPDLVTRAAEAMQDEIRHARACFELARRHTGEQMGPGPLDVNGALDGLDLTNIVLDTIAEGCIGETVAALEAAEALSHCEDMAARAVLRRISVEEGRHAELAWQFVSWALQTGPHSLKERVRSAFSEALAGARREPVRMTQRDRDLLRHGLVSESLRAPLRASVLAEVVGPCAKALLEGVGTRPVRDGREALAVA